MQVMIRKYGAAGASLVRRASVGLVSLGVSAAAMAQADPFDAALSEISDKVSGYGAALVGLAAVAVVFFVAIKYVKKIPKAS